MLLPDSFEPWRSAGEIALEPNLGSDQNTAVFLKQLPVWTASQEGAFLEQIDGVQNLFDPQNGLSYFVAMLFLYRCDLLYSAI